jgi:hypothetical protein
MNGPIATATPRGAATRATRSLANSGLRTLARCNDRSLRTGVPDAVDPPRAITD